MGDMKLEDPLSKLNPKGHCDYYISEFAFTEQWKTFLTQFINEGFTYESFEEEYYKLMYDVYNTFSSLTADIPPRL